MPLPIKRKPYTHVLPVGLMTSVKEAAADFEPPTLAAFVPYLLTLGLRAHLSARRAKLYRLHPEEFK